LRAVEAGRKVGRVHSVRLGSFLPSVPEIHQVTGGTKMPRFKTILTSLIVTFITVSVLNRIPAVKRFMNGE
jgi:hypothetical protein